MIKILEIGCGQGFRTYVLSKNKKNEVVGIDFSKQELKIAKKRYPNVKFLYMNAEKLSFKNNIFDEILAMDVLEHVDNLKKVVNEIYRVLKKNGKLIVNIPFYKSEFFLLKIRPTFHKEIHHVRVFKINELEQMLEKKGFFLVKKEGRDFLQHIELYFLFKRKIKSKTQVSIGSWRDNYITIFIHIIVLYFNSSVIDTPLVYFPIWVVTVPIGSIVNYLFNKVFPRSLYYEFVKL